MKLTEGQLSDLLNQHIGTGHIIVHLADNTARVVDINLGRDNQWYAGRQSLNSYLNDLATEIATADTE